MSESLASLRQKGGGGSAKMMSVSGGVGKSGNNFYSWIGYTNASDVFDATSGLADASSVSFTVKKAGKYDYLLQCVSRGSAGSATVNFNGTTVSASSVEQKTGEVVLGANTTCTFTLTNGSIFQTGTIILTEK